MRGLRQYETSTIVIAVAVSVGVVLLLRPAWLILTQWLPRSRHTWLGGVAEQDDTDDPDAARRLGGVDRNARGLTSAKWWP
ncbi:hypothetical protein V2I01_21690 [Micromonospora sp. BRA006-A]|nr:hypothetical protein [Micromonospora sp. BRA006-A]